MTQQRRGRAGIQTQVYSTPWFECKKRDQKGFLSSAFSCSPSDAFSVHLQRKHRVKIKQQILFGKVFYLSGVKWDCSKQEVSAGPSCPSCPPHSRFCTEFLELTPYHLLVWCENFLFPFCIAFWFSRLLWLWRCMMLRTVEKTGVHWRRLCPLRSNICLYRTSPTGVWSQTQWIRLHCHKKKLLCVHTCPRMIQNSRCMQIKDGYKFLTLLLWREGGLFFLHLNLGPMTTLNSKIWPKWYCASSGPRFYENWQLPSWSLRGFSLVVVSYIRVFWVPWNYHAMRKSKLATWRNSVRKEEGERVEGNGRRERLDNLSDIPAPSHPRCGVEVSCPSVSCLNSDQ